MVIRANIGKKIVHFFSNNVGRILVDIGSSTNIITWQCFVQMGFTEKDLKKSTYPLIGFGGKKIEAVGKANINVTFGEGATMRTKVITFDIMDLHHPYNAIFGRNIIYKFASAIHRPYLCMKIPTAGGVLSVFGSEEEARRCEGNTSQSSKNVRVIEENKGELEDENEAEGNQSPEGVRPAEHTKKVPLCDDVPEHIVNIGKGLELAEEERLVQFLRNNQDVFAWSLVDLKGVGRDLTEHILNIDLKSKPVRQKLRTMSEERKKMAKAEVQKLLDAGVIREIQFSEWLANVVMVPKKNGKWRMCNDFTILNKDYLFRCIDTLVDAAAGLKLMSLLVHIAI